MVVQQLCSQSFGCEEKVKTTQLVSWSLYTYYVGFNEIAEYYYTSCPWAPVAPRHVASCHADEHYVQSRNMKYWTFRDPGG